MKTAAETRQVLDELEAQHPGADTELRVSNAFELLLATMLSAQSTDQRVNLVTPALFKRYPNAAKLARATPVRLEPQIHSTGFFRTKSKALVGMARALVARHGGEVPASMEALVELPGVGRKTANVVLGHAFGVPGLPVDRHVLRVANRLGIAESDNPEIVEQQLSDRLPSDRWTRTSDMLILHGRRICRPKPMCDRCAAQEHCAYFQTVVTRGGIPAGRSARGTASPPTTASGKRRRGPEGGAGDLRRRTRSRRGPS